MTDDAKAIAFTPIPDADVSDKLDAETEHMRKQAENSVNRSIMRKEIEAEKGVAPEKRGTLTKDTPKAMFRLGAGFIGCDKFNLSDDEATIYANSLNVLFPVEGKIIAVCNIILITLGKVLTCMDAIKKKFAKEPATPPAVKQSKAPEGSVAAGPSVVRTKEENDALFGKPMGAEDNP